ncbi:hypothetical protein LC040_08825 [Bacillus tianshenii]|nr:hypothetical protein LC040_08825 [Bacillus tianshenii]
MNELQRLQLVAEAVLEFKTQIKNDFEVEKVGRLVLDIVRGMQDEQLTALVEEAYQQLPDYTAATQCLSEAQSYIDRRLDGLMTSQ